MQTTAFAEPEVCPRCHEATVSRLHVSYQDHPLPTASAPMSFRVVRDDTYLPVPAPRRLDTDARFARGAVFGVVLALPFWIAIAMWVFG